MLKTLGLATGGSILLAKGLEAKANKMNWASRDKDLTIPDEPITFIVLGAGNRGNVYAHYSEMFPGQMKIVGVAEPIVSRRKRFSERYGIPEENQFVTWEDVFKKDKFADCIICAMPDKEHYLSALASMDAGYDLLLEKPIAQNWEQCNDILQKQKETKKVVAVCHVLRYTPFYMAMNEIVESGRLGRLINIEHTEAVSYWHMAHSFVRGNWRSSEESNPMILTKSCHDTDIIRWLTNEDCQKLSSFGSLTHFKAENAPNGSAKRCTDCMYEEECPYSALKMYMQPRFRGWSKMFAEDLSRAAILKGLQESGYGRCVYHCDNDVVDHQVVAMQFAKEITGTFTMCGFANTHGTRITRLMGTEGEAIGDLHENEIFVHDFLTDKVDHLHTTREDAIGRSGHGGGDYGLVQDFIQAVIHQDESLLTSNLDASMHSHLMGYKAEESRLKEKVLSLA